jgi:predicted ATPase
MSAGRIESVRIRGFRSLADVELSNLQNANVLIGANGSGKSNFIRFFEMMSWMLRSRRLGEFVERHGGADDQLYGGNSVTPRLEGELALRTDKGRNDYRFALSYAHPDRFIFTEEAYRFSATHHATDAPWQHVTGGHREAAIVDVAQASSSVGPNPVTARVIVHLLRGCQVFQFHDTSGTSNFKKRWDAQDNDYLRTHGGNLAAVLHRLEEKDVKRFDLICRHVRRALPVFDRFQVDESYGKVSLRWKASGTDKTFGAHLTSDGSLRFFALVTLLNLPPEMLPDVLLLDEPELGLHPAAIALVGGMIKSLAMDRQIIVATQSPLLVDAFDLHDIVVLELQDGRTMFRRPDAEGYQRWLDEGFMPGEMWRKNLIGGRP